MRLRDHVVGALVLLHVLYVGAAAIPPDDTAGHARRAMDAVCDVVRRAGWPYAQYLGTEQAWAMFADPPTVNGRLEVSVSDGREWRVVYAERSETATWRRGVFDHYRWRERIRQFHRPGPEPGWRPFAEWVAAELFAAEPGAVAVRLEVRAATVPDPAVFRRRRGLVFRREPLRSVVLPRHVE